MAKRAFLVLGPESAGNKLFTELLCNSGCEGDYDHEQRFDKDPINKGDSDPLSKAKDWIVWRRSMPHGHAHMDWPYRGWPNLELMLTRLRRNGFIDVRVFAVIRSHYSMVRSQVDREHLRNEPTLEAKLKKAEQNAAAAMRRIGFFAHENGLRIRYVTYESILHDMPLIKLMLKEWGLELQGDPVKINADNNKKYEDWDRRHNSTGITE